MSDLVKQDDQALVELWLQLKVSPHTRRAYASEAAKFMASTPKPLGLVKLEDLAGYQQGLGQGTDLKPASQNRALTAIKSLLAFGHEAGYLPFNVGAAVKLRPNRDGLAQRILDEAEVERLIRQTPPGRDRVLLHLLYVSGVRVSELAALKWQDTLGREDGGQITVLGKGGRTRAIRLKPSSWRALEELRGQAEAGDPVFASRRGGHLDASQIRRIVYAAAERAGVKKKVSPHWMRHAHASHALDRGAPIHLVQATLGHSSVATTGRYLHARPAESSALYLPGE